MAQPPYTDITQINPEELLTRHNNTDYCRIKNFCLILQPECTKYRRYIFLPAFRRSHLHAIRTIFLKHSCFISVRMNGIFATNILMLPDSGHTHNTLQNTSVEPGARFPNPQITECGARSSQRLHRHNMATKSY